MFAMHVPLVGGRHDLSLLRQSGWENQLSQFLKVNNRQFYIMEIQFVGALNKSIVGFNSC